MSKLSIDEQQITNEIVDELTRELRSKQDHILAKIGTIQNKKNYTFGQFNGVFGGKNNTYVDSVRTQFLDFDDFYAQWLKGLIDAYENDESYAKRYSRPFDEDRASFRNLKLIQDEEIEAFVKLFLERNFYKKLNERTRVKPDEKLWSIWFGYQLIYGLLIAPVKWGEWTNDKSEIRKTHYDYWTVEHILTEGLIDPALDKPIRFNAINDFFDFYLSVLKRTSNSIYEQMFCDKYIEYLKKSKNVTSEPFLIPEFRYDGVQKKHIHRLDFTILNIHTIENTGFEISPASSHMSVTNLKVKQNKVNEELKEKWEKEMQKRNDYFKNFGISTITFTDSMLVDVDNCFKKVIEKLQSRPKNRIRLKSQLNRLAKIK